ncbi:B3 domain-containing protein, DNA-binding pseudobarrel domain protein [Tanacetum coccineum]
MEKNVGNAASKHDNDVIDEDEEEYYLGKIKALVKEKWKAYARENNINYISSDDESTGNGSLDEQMESVGGSNRKGSSMDEVDNKNKKGKMVVDSDDVITELQEFITSDEINGSDIKLVIKKRVYTRPTQNWLNMPFKHLETHDFLTPEEKQVLGDGSEIEVALVGPNLQMYKKPMSLTIGGMWKNKNYVLKTNWSDFVGVNKDVLKEGTAIQVWSFRNDEQLCFAVVCVD